MPRKGHIAKRERAGRSGLPVDLVTKFVNSMMWQGKKSTAQGIFYERMKKLQEKGGDEALKLFKKAVENAKPLLEVKTRRVGGANYQVPVEVNADRRTSLAIRWIITYARGRGEKGMIDKLTQRIAGCGQWPRRSHQEEGRRAPHGGSQQGVRALSLVEMEAVELAGIASRKQRRFDARITKCK